ncbi:hypothetical protein IBX65_06375 [Candidatus Aerophobetes bacterium]|nr:hypothetical protein [Candidatus Aerophobetes bacterium]
MIGLILATCISRVWALLIKRRDKKYFQEIEEKIHAFKSKAFPAPEEKEREKELLKKDLITLQAKISYEMTQKEAEHKIRML